MRERLRGFEQTAAQHWRVRSVNGDTTQEQRWLFEDEPTINRILRHLSPDKPGLGVLGQDDWQGLTINLGEVSRGLGILADMDEWATRLAPEAPSLPADRLHPWVWDAARTFWESAHYRAAVHAAATSGRPRLRIPGDPGDPGVQTRQRGALQLGQGAYSALRNPAAHEIGDLDEQEALEQLAVFSLIARLINQCQVII
ncbi:hypothetical protein DBP20_18150 [Streptomyces sp. CS131]|nr:hypothetical protein DBP20_18150 [Streptomyces sp. CS131]